MDLSPAVKESIDSFREQFADVVISAEDAQRLFLGDKDSLVAELSDFEIVQLCLIHSHDTIRDLIHRLQGADILVESLEKRLAKQPSREKRRHP